MTLKMTPDPDAADCPVCGAAAGEPCHGERCIEAPPLVSPWRWVWRAAGLVGAGFVAGLAWRAFTWAGGLR